MRHFLQEHAIQNVWCSPKQDYPGVLKLTRITPPLGAFQTAQVGWDKLRLPDNKSTFHVYQIGHNLPKKLGFSETQETWVKLSSVCTDNNVVIDFYLSNGLQWPRGETWFYITKNQTLVVAAKRLPVIADLDKNTLFMRTYSGAFFHSKYKTAGDRIVCAGGLLNSKEAIVALQEQFLSYKALSRGVAYAFHNGRFTDSFGLTNVTIGDVVEFVYDSSIYKVIDLPVKDLPVFDSSLDLKGKYLLHQPKAGVQWIDYRDDLDLFLFRNENGRNLGYYYNRNTEDAVRMVTHSDYSIPVDYLAAYASSVGWDTLEESTVRIHIRLSGYQRKFFYENNRINELYKLSDDKILQAFVGVNATLKQWQAAELEASAYNKLLGAEYKDVTLPLVEEAYGYNAMSKVAGDTPQLVNQVGQSLSYVELPVGLQDSSTVYEYDADGWLLGAVAHTGGKLYEPQHSECKLVEAQYGAGGRVLNYYRGSEQVQLNPLVKYRFYRTPKIGLLGKRVWEDITEQPYYEQDSNGLVLWYDTENYLYAAIGDDKFLTYGFNLDYANHQLKFSLTHEVDGNSEVLEIPPGRLDLWLNGRSLIEGLDYFVKFPQVVICNKSWLNQDGTGVQRVIVRCTGFCNDKLEREDYTDFGFVTHGMLSDDSQFDLRDDQVVRCVVDGSVLHRSALRFAEDTQAVYTTAREGAPYLVSKVVVPLPGLVPYETWVRRTESLAIDKSVSGYLTKYLPLPANEAVTVIPKPHWLYSPFLCRILYDLLQGFIVVDSLYRPDSQILKELSRYKPLLDFDPCLKAIDNRFVVIHPHDKIEPVQVTIAQYAYLNRVIKLYLKDRLDLSLFVTIQG